MELSFQVSTKRLLLPLPVTVDVRPSGAIGRERQNYRPHHIHFLMAQDVAVIGVFPAEVDQLVDDRVGWVALGIDVVEHRRGAKRHHRVQRPDGVGQFERHLRDDGPQGDDGVFQRADTGPCLSSPARRVRLE